MKLLGIGSRIKHHEYGVGVITNVSPKFYWVTFIENGLETIELDSEFEVIEALEDEVDSVSFFEVEKALKNLLEKYSDIGPKVSIADKWKGGKIVLEPGTQTQNKEISIDTFFNKVVMVRDRLREKKKKIELQQYITRCYGSLTTFNVLFKNQSDFFVGEKSK